MDAHEPVPERAGDGRVQWVVPERFAAEWPTHFDSELPPADTHTWDGVQSATEMIIGEVVVEVEVEAEEEVPSAAQPRILDIVIRGGEWRGGGAIVLGGRTVEVP